MTTSSHTPGTWEVIPSNDPDWNLIDSHGNIIAIIKMGDSVARSEYTESNAKLIAAAPDMLEALKRINQLTMEGGSIGIRMDLVQATVSNAIAKATS